MKKLIKTVGAPNNKNPKRNEVVQHETPKTSSHDESLVELYDEYDRPVFVRRESWIKDIFMPNLLSSYDRPNELYNLIITGLDDGLHENLMDASFQLYQIDANMERGACCHAIVLMKNDKLDEAESVLKETMLQNGGSGVLLTNLAKVYAHKGMDQASYDVLSRALEVDPNQENGLDWFVSINREAGGEEAVVSGLSKLGNLKGAWRPNLLLARYSLIDNDLDTALEYYNRVFSVVDNIDADALKQIFDTLYNLAIGESNNSVFKLMFISALGKNRSYNSPVYLEYEKKAKKLINEWVDDSSAKAVAVSTVAEIFERE